MNTISDKPMKLHTVLNACNKSSSKSTHTSASAIIQCVQTASTTNDHGMEKRALLHEWNCNIGFAKESLDMPHTIWQQLLCIHWQVFHYTLCMSAYATSNVKIAIIEQTDCPPNNTSNLMSFSDPNICSKNAQRF